MEGLSRRAPPPSSFRSEFFDPETQEDLRPLVRSQSLHDRLVRTASETYEKSPLRLQRATSELKGSLMAALQHSKSFKSQLSRSSSVGAKEVLYALQRTASGDFREASAQVESAWRRFERGFLAHILARTLVCIFFLDNCLEKYKNWEFYQAEFWQRRIALYPHRYKDPGFPYFALGVILPCALMTIMGIGTRLTASVLVLDMLRNSAGIMMAGLLRIFQHKMEPDELAAKNIAMLGSALLVLAHAVRDKYATSNTVAGLLIGDPDKSPSRLKSIVLLFSRLTLTLLFLTVGISQIKRVIRRDWAIFAHHEYLRADGHDNNFLILEAILAVPFALGYRTRLVSPLLAVTLLAEAIFCWSPFEKWPSVQYQSHVRSHFATNLGAAGGLLLLQTCGAGRYTMDGLLRPKKII